MLLPTGDAVASNKSVRGRREGTMEIRRLYPSDPRGLEQIRTLLARQGLTLDNHLEYTVGLWEGDRLLATGSFFRSTLRCLAVDEAFRSEGLMATMVTHLVGELFQRGRHALFMYTKADMVSRFEGLGFYEVAATSEVALLSNQRDGFDRYMVGLQQATRDVAQQRGLPGVDAAIPSSQVGAIVMNANPFTLGHRWLVEQAARQCDVVHLFMVSEDISAFPLAVRERMIRAGTADLSNVICHPTGPYLVSSATFPAYFIGEGEALTLAQARIDTAVFVRIAKALGITDRFVGEEPLSPATALYNQAMGELLPGAGIRLHVVPRTTGEGTAPISASRVRALLAAGQLEHVRALVPASTYAFLRSDEGQAIADALRKG